MEEPSLPFYFRRIRMIYCREQQLIDLMPDLVSEATSSSLKEALIGDRTAARRRHHMISGISANHGISPLGDECLAMRKMIAIGCARLGAEGLGERHDRSVEAFGHELHRVVLVDYRLARDRAVALDLPTDISCFDEVIQAMSDIFPKKPLQAAHSAVVPSSRAAMF